MEAKTGKDRKWRYDEVTTFIEGLVEHGALAAGARVPSLRRLSRERNVSIGTVLEAYRRLEDSGVIEARQGSGFYVVGKPVRLQDLPVSQPPDHPVSIETSAILQVMLRHASDPDFAPLGCAIPSETLLNARALDRTLARVVRHRGIAANVYTHPQGDLRLRQEISRRVLSWDVAASPADIAITCGCTEAIGLALGAVCRPGDTVAMESPAYFGFLRLAKMLDLRVLELPTHPLHGVDPTALDDLLDRHRVSACLLSSSFSNPSGYTAPDETKAAIVRLLGRRGIPLIEDDTYGELYFGARRSRPYSAFARNGEVIYCSSFSKVLAPGYRVGWLVTGRHMAPILDRKFATTLCGPALPQIAIGEFLADGAYDNHLRRLRKVFAHNLSCALNAIDRSFPAGTKVSRPEGGFMLWVQLPDPVDTRLLFEQALRANICFAPGSLFSAQGAYSNCLRISCGTPFSPEISDAFARLGDLIAAQAMAVSSSYEAGNGSPVHRNHA